MKNPILNFLCFTILSFVITITGFAQSQGKRYGLKKAHIHYNVEGTMQSGSEDLYFS